MLDLSQIGVFVLGVAGEVFDLGGGMGLRVGGIRELLPTAGYQVLFLSATSTHGPLKSASSALAW